MLPEREDVGRALEYEEAARLLKACFESSQPSLYPAVVVYCNTGLRSAELRCARCWQVNFAKCEFQVGRTKTATGGWPDHSPESDRYGRIHRVAGSMARRQADRFHFSQRKALFRGKGSAKLGVMSSHELDRSRPLGSWKTAWNTAKKRAGVECRASRFEALLLDQPGRDRNF